MRKLLISLGFVFLILASLAAAPSYAQGGIYTVRAGDTLTGIAARYGISISQLAIANGLRVNSWVYTGQRLTIPGAAASPAPAASSTSGSSYIVRWGDTLTGIAARHRVSVSQLAAANGMRVNAWVYTGQRLTIPGAVTASPPPAQPTLTAPATPSGTYIVRRGDTLIGIARRYGISTSQLAARNGLTWNSWVYVGQKLTISGASTTPAAPTPSNPASQSGSSGKWIGVNLSTQTLTAYEGQTAIFTARVSTGTQWTPTVAGTYSIYVKYTSAPMSGPGYYLPNVPYVMYFYRGYGIHGTYWHSNFGTPMSHGCVNMATEDAQWLFNWAPVGTKVVTHY